MASKYQQQFWKHDVKVARDYNQTLGTCEGASLKERLFEDLAHFHGDEFRTLSSRFSDQHTWSPMMRQTKTSRMTIQELEQLYLNPTFSKAESRPTTFVKTNVATANSYALTQSFTFRRLNRVGALGKSLSPPKYQPLKNDVGNDSRNRNMPPTSLKPSSRQILGRSKINPDVIREINETPRNSRADGEVQSKSKFVVTRAVDPLHSNKNCK